jgi:hypothetical protein
MDREHATTTVGTENKYNERTSPIGLKAPIRAAHPSAMAAKKNNPHTAHVSRRRKDPEPRLAQMPSKETKL